MKISRPWASSVCEKSPCISRSVGIVQLRTGPGPAHDRRLERIEEEQLLVVLFSPGTGPPRFAPKVLKR